MSYQANKFNQPNCQHCSDHFAELQYYNQGVPGTVNTPKIGAFVRSAWGAVGFSSKNKAYQNEGSYATLNQAYPGFNGVNPKNLNNPRCN